MYNLGDHSSNTGILMGNYSTGYNHVG